MAGSGMDNLNSSIGQFNSTLERTKNSISGIVQEITTFADAMRGGVSSTSGGSSAVPQGSSAATPRFSAPSSTSGIGSGITNFLASIPAVMGAALGSPASIASYQLGTSRSAFFANQSYGANAASQMQMSLSGTANSSTDALAAQAALQSAGIFNIQQFGKGVSSLSNYAPGLGLAGTAMATASLNSAQTVNKLNMLGISERGSNGLALDPNTIINEFVDMIFAKTPQLQQGSAAAYSYLMGALESGNQLNIMLSTYFTDPNLINLVITKLFAKAKGLPDNATKSQLTAAGITTKTTNLMSNYNAAQLNLTQATTNGILQGSDAALSQLTSATNDFAGAAKNLNGLLKAYGYGETMLGGFNGAVTLLATSIAGNLLGPLLSLLSGGKGGLGGLLSTGKGLLGVAASALAGYGVGDVVAQGGKALGNALGTSSTVTRAGSAAAAAGAGALAGAAIPILGETGISEVIGAIAGGISGWLHSKPATTTGAGSGSGRGATVSPSNTMGGGSTAPVSALLTTAASQIGVPYSWGGGGVNGPSSGFAQGAGTVGFDCSSFVQYVFSKQGVSLPRTTYAQVNCGTAVPPLQAQPGDLLFFGSATAPDHVAIYLGGGRIIQAPHTGGVVSIAGVDLSTVSACRRVLNGSGNGVQMSTLFNSQVMSSIGMGSSPMPNTVGGFSAAGGMGGALSALSGTATAAPSTVAGYSSAVSSGSGVATTSGSGITINVTVPASTSPNAIAQTTKAVATAVQQGIARANARSN